MTENKANMAKQTEDKKPFLWRWQYWLGLIGIVITIALFAISREEKPVIALQAVVLSNSQIASTEQPGLEEPIKLQYGDEDIQNLRIFSVRITNVGNTTIDSIDEAIEDERNPRVEMVFEDIVRILNVSSSSDADDPSSVVELVQSDEASKVTVVCRLLNEDASVVVSAVVTVNASMSERMFKQLVEPEMAILGKDVKGTIGNATKVTTDWYKIRLTVAFLWMIASVVGMGFGGAYLLESDKPRLKMCGRMLVANGVFASAVLLLAWIGIELLAIWNPA